VEEDLAFLEQHLITNSPSSSDNVPAYDRPYTISGGSSRSLPFLVHRSANVSMARVGILLTLGRMRQPPRDTWGGLSPSLPSSLRLQRIHAQMEKGKRHVEAVGNNAPPHIYTAVATQERTPRPSQHPYTWSKALTRQARIPNGNGKLVARVGCCLFHSPFQSLVPCRRRNGTM